MSTFDELRILASRRKIAQFPEPRKLLANPESVDYREQGISLEEQRLLEQLKEIRSKKEEILKEKKRIEEEERKKKPEVFKFKKCEYGYVLFELEHKNPDVIEIINNHTGKPYYETEYYCISLDKFDDMEREIVRKYPRTQWINFEPVKRPFWKIFKKDKVIAVQWNPITNENGYRKKFEGNGESIYKIPGVETYSKFFSVPFSEGWRLLVIHPETEDTKFCEWEQGLLDEVRIEFEKRLKVKLIHTAEDSEVDQDFTNLPNFKLRPHQRVALEFAELVDRKTIIAYGTGTGKTAIAIADAIKSGSERILVVCPGALRANWRNHIRNHTGIEPSMLAGRAPEKVDYVHLLKKKPKWAIINYEILRSAIPNKENRKFIYPWVDLISLWHPQYVIVDESHYVKNPDAHQSKAVRALGNSVTHKMALSGTPIMNRPGELWSILNWLHPEQFPFYETFLRQYGFGRSIGTYEAQKLRSLLETIMIKRSRQDISKNLPPVNRIVETFTMSNRARAIYDRILEGIYTELAEFDHLGEGGQERRFKHILPKLNAMIKVCAADKVDSTVERATEIADSIEEEPWNKVLIFTHFKGTCNTISRKLGGEALSFVRRTNKGFVTLEMEERMEIVSQFQNDPSIRFLVATEKSAREGLDITKAGVVMFNDLFWTPAGHIQCEGRAFYRESDMHGGDSYYLTFEDTIEDWIVELQGIKQNTIDKIVEGKGIDINISSQIIERLKNLLRERKK